MTVLSIIKLLPENNEQVSKFSNDLNDSLDSGDINPLDVLLCIKGFEKVIKNVKENLNSLAVDELDAYYEKDIKYKSAELRKVETGTKYDFAGCEDLAWNTFKSDEDKLKSNIKDREKFLKTLKKSINLIDEGSGEVYEIHPPARTSTTTAKVILG